MFVWAVLSLAVNAILAVNLVKIEYLRMDVEAGLSVGTFGEPRAVLFWMNELTGWVLAVGEVNAFLLLMSQKGYLLELRQKVLQFRLSGSVICLAILKSILGIMVHLRLRWLIFCLLRIWCSRLLMIGSGLFLWIMGLFISFLWLYSIKNGLFWIIVSLFLWFWFSFD